MKFTTKLVCFLLCVLLCGCGAFDSGVVWRAGPYALLWIDTPDDVSLSYDAGKGGWINRVESQVFAVGSNDEYIVVKQHPNKNKTKTDFFFITRSKDSLNADLKAAVTGPLSAEEFGRKSDELKLPPFSLVLEALK